MKLCNVILDVVKLTGAVEFYRGRSIFLTEPFCLHAFIEFHKKIQSVGVFTIHAYFMTLNFSQMKTRSRSGGDSLARVFPR